MGRRDYGTGSIQPRGERRWQLRWYAAADPVTGERKRRSETFVGIRKEALARLRDLTLEPAEADLTLADAIRLWRAAAKHTPGTARNYDLAEKTLAPATLAKPIAELRAATVRAIIDHVHATHNVHRARYVHAAISGALTHAWRNEWIVDNPARRVKVLRQPSRKHTTPTDSDVRAALTVARRDPELFAWIFLSAVLGSRPGEIRALRWSDIDLDGGQVAIVKTLDPITGTEKTTKNDVERPLAIGAATVDVLRTWRVAFLERAMEIGTKPIGDPYVFCTDLLGAVPWTRNQATGRWAKVRTEAGVSCRLYDLRHYAGTIALTAAPSPKDGQYRLGHTRLQTFTDTYAHDTPTGDLIIADEIERRLQG